MKKYELVEKYIKDKISIGVYLVGHRIPSEDELIEKLQMSRNPIRRALENLTKEGCIYKIQGSGSYVKDLTIPEPVDIYAILPSESVNLETRIIQGMRAALEDSSYKNIHLILKKPGKDTYEQIEVLNMILKHRKSGIIFIPLVPSDRTTSRLLAANIRKIERQGIPIIQIDNYIPEYNGSCIMTDHQKSAADMMNLLYENGHKKIALLYRNTNKPSVKLRIKGVKQWYEAAGIPVTNLIRCNIDEQPIDEAFVSSLFSSGVTAVFGFECELVRDLYLMLEQLGYEVPGDISLCSFDDHCFAGLRNGFITAVVQRCDTIGYYAVQLLLDMLEGKTEGNLEMKIASDIKKRKSVGKI
ncbi:MAG: GntR family transcriptional regulator [Spirochaetales bacterium]|jgi:GntR family transcriptional regulator of arabinose operon|nr:GntR family transcriptional regulator [Spirochaetales bacterium]